jgi:MFS transporter, DHA1 family, multidrug resistance protein
MRKIFPPLAFAMFSSNLGMGIVAPLLSIYAKEMGASSFWIGLVMSSYAMANIISTPMFGRISDGKGRKIFILIGLLVYSLISLGYIFAHVLPVLCLVRFLHGSAGGMVLPIASAYIGDNAPKGQEGKWMGYASAAFFGGFGVGPLLGGVMSQYLGMTFTFSFMAGLNFLAFLITLIFLPESKNLKIRDTGPRVSFFEIIRNKVIKGLFTFQIAGAVGQGCFTSFLPILAAARGLSLTMIGVIISCTLSLMALLGAITGGYADKMNKRLLISVGGALVVLALFLMPQPSSFWLILPVCLLMATGAGFTNPAISAMGVYEGRNYGMGSTMGVVNMGMSIGFATGPIVAGKIADLGQISYAFYFGCGVLILGILLFLWFTKRNSSPL